MVNYCSSFSSQCWHLFFFCPHLHCVFSSVSSLIVFLTHIFAFFCSFPPALHYTPRNCLRGPALRSSAVKVNSINLTVKDLYRLYKQSRKDKTTKGKKMLLHFHATDLIDWQKTTIKFTRLPIILKLSVTVFLLVCLLFPFCAVVGIGIYDEPCAASGFLFPILPASPP